MAIKYYGTLTSLGGDCWRNAVSLGYIGSHNQFRIVCKAKSMAEANRISEKLGFGKNVFRTNWACETGNKEEIEFADKHGFIISLNGSSGGNFVDIRQIINNA